MVNGILNFDLDADFRMGRICVVGYIIKLLDFEPDIFEAINPFMVEG